MKKEKMLAVVLSVVMAFAANISFASADTDRFNDINGHWGQSIINEAASLGVVGGYPEGNYLPDNLMKREEFYKLITNVLTVVPDTSNTVLTFKDVDPIEWYVPTVKTAVAAGITKGYEDGTFGVGQMISRQEAAKVVASIISTDNLDTSKNASSSKDASLIGTWALPSVNIMFQKGYMQGDNEGNFRPTMALTRAEAATLLLNVKKKESVIKGPGADASTPGDTVPVGVGGCQKYHSTTEGAFTVGTGTAKDPYEVSTANQLDHIREHLNEGGFYTLTKDIKIGSDFATTVPTLTTQEADWSGGNFAPIGTEQKPFVGNIDGNGHSISGLSIEGTIKGNADTGNVASYAGLLGYMSKTSTVDDLTIDDSKIKGGAYVGGIAGYSKGSITNCVLGSKSSVIGQSNTGGIVGYSTEILKSNLNKGSVEGTSTNTGGIVGNMDMEGEALNSCVNQGTVKGKTRTGGVAGYIVASSAPTTIESCSNAGNVSSTADYAGGVVGQVDGSSYGVYIKDCYNTGELSGEGGNGGIVGYSKGDRTRITDCYNTGEINGKNAGGIAGNNEGYVEKCYNKGKVVADSEAGGIVAYQNTGEGRMEFCYNDGSVTANSNAGGLVGLSKDKIYNSYNTGKIKATNSVGGLVGRNYANIHRSYNVGEVDGSNGEGSLVGRNSSKLTNCFWLKGTCDLDIGTEDSASSKSMVKMLSKEQLSGQLKVKLEDGFQLLTDYMNAKNTTKVWEYTYKVSQAAPGSSSTVISDGGGIVPPVEMSTTEEKGNGIDPASLNTDYLYPSLIELKRK